MWSIGVLLAVAGMQSNCGDMTRQATDRAPVRHRIRIVVADRIRSSCEGERDSARVIAQKAADPQ